MENSAERTLFAFLYADSLARRRKFVALADELVDDGTDGALHAVRIWRFLVDELDVPAAKGWLMLDTTQLSLAAGPIGTLRLTEYSDRRLEWSTEFNEPLAPGPTRNAEAHRVLGAFLGVIQAAQLAADESLPAVIRCDGFVPQIGGAKVGALRPPFSAWSDWEQLRLGWNEVREHEQKLQDRGEPDDQIRTWHAVAWLNLVAYVGTHEVSITKVAVWPPRPDVFRVAVRSLVSPPEPRPELTAWARALPLDIFAPDLRVILEEELGVDSESTERRKRALEWLNTADEDLERLLSAGIAARVRKQRETGPFKSLNEALHIKGIGWATIERIVQRFDTR